MAKHRAFNADRFLDKFEGHEPLLRAYVGTWNGRSGLHDDALDVPRFKEYLAHGRGEGKDEVLEGLYRAHDLCTERGHEDLAAACGECGYEPDPAGALPVECLSLKVRTENEDAFNLAYDRHNLFHAERFSLFRAREARPIADLVAAGRRLLDRLAEAFKRDKKSERVLVRLYREGARVNVIVYHEKRTKAELTFRGTGKVSPTVFRPAQQDFLSYDEETGQLEIEARFQNEEATLRKGFAECCLGDAEAFEGPDAADRLDLARILRDDFRMDVAAGDGAALVDLHVGLPQESSGSLTVSSRNAISTLDLFSLRQHLAGATVRRAVFKLTFPDDRRGKRVHLSGSNSVKFKRATHADEVFGYLRAWGVIRA